MRVKKLLVWVILIRLRKLLVRLFPEWLKKQLHILWFSLDIQLRFPYIALTQKARSYHSMSMTLRV